MTFTLRDYQTRDIERMREAMRGGSGRILYQLPTGGGKTVQLAWMAARAAERGKRTMFIVHRQELMIQASRTFDAMGVAHGLIAPGHTMSRDLVQVASVQALVRRFKKVTPPDLIIFDEAHHCPSNTWRRVFERYCDARAIGLTATPCRLDGRGLNDLFETLICGPSVSDLIGAGHLSEYTAYAPPIGIDTQGIRTRAGDFARDQLQTAVDKPTITGDAVRHYLKLARGKRAVAFCVGIAHSEHVAEQFRSVGVRAVHIDGTEASSRRARIMERFAAGDIQVLTNCDLISEGFDVPAMEAVILLRPTKSLSLYLQQVGRALRPIPGKTAIILDHAGNVLRHGLPDDERTWTLEGRKTQRGEKRDENIPVKQCERCFACYAPAPACPSCGHVNETAGREVEHVEGELEQIDIAALRRQQQLERGRAKTLEDLQKIEAARGYKPGWARHVFNARKRKRGAAA
ncbi:MAG: DEAD/DEAH box helicase [Chloroflexi bacterium]|nr:DEAD/DEAH box helicase [Chloroflexota bacterium]